MSKADADDAAATSELLWRRHSTPSPARTGLTVDRIVEAAVELADANGLGALSMARLAEQLGFAPMALYRHVPSKDALLQLIADAALGTPSLSLNDPEEDWRLALRRWSEELIGVLGAHPWAIGILSAGPPIRPSQLAWLDRGLRALADTPLDHRERVDVVVALTGVVFFVGRNRATEGPPPAQGSGPLGVELDAAEFPAVLQALDAGVFEPEGGEEDRIFLACLDLILDGAASLMRVREESDPVD